MHENRTVEARRVGELLQIRGDKPGKRAWRTATTPEDRDTALAVLEQGGSVVLGPKPSPEDLERAKRSLDLLGTPVRRISSHGIALSQEDVGGAPPPGDVPEPPPAPPDAPPPPPPPVAAPRPISFLLEGRDVPASPATLEAAVALARAIAADAAKADTHPKAAEIWGAGRVRLGDLLREVVTFQFGAPEDFRDGLEPFAVVGVR